MPLFGDGDCPPLRRWSEPAQIIFFAVTALAVNCFISLLIAPLQFSSTRVVFDAFIQDKGLIGAYFILVSAPLYETIVGQWAPMVFTKWLKKPTQHAVFYAAIWFGLIHIRAGAAYVIQNIGVGWILAGCFLFGRREGFFKAYRLTTIAHALHNTLVFFILYFSSSS